MCDTIGHRGPDDRGYYVDKDVSLGHCRLSIIDLSERGRQPMGNEDGSVQLVCNGEIYNFRELRELLEAEGHMFSSDSDNEVILHAYEKWGMGCLDHFNGMFAFALWDSRKKTLYLVRDRVGQKPVYYFFDGKRFVFASEIKAILEHDIPRRVDIEALNYYMGFRYTQAPHTLFEGICKLPAGHYISLRDGKLETVKYWDVSDFSDVDSSMGDVAKRIKSLLGESVRMRLISDRPVGLFLSGGTDSSAILAYMNDYVGGKIKTYSVGFESEVGEIADRLNEDLNIARNTAEYFGAAHHELLVSSKMIEKNIENAVYHFDEPIAEAAALSQFLLARYAKKSVSVVLGGDGGDELFCGYKRHGRHLLISKYQRVPKTVRRGILFPLASAVYPKIKSKRSKLESPPTVERHIMLSSDKKGACEVLKEGVFDWEFNEGIVGAHFNSPDTEDLLKRVTYTDLKTQLAEHFLNGLDKMTMAFALEARSPLLDYRMVEFAYKIPTKMKIKGGTTKYIFKRAVSGKVPRAPLKGKRPWFSPSSRWIRESYFEGLINDYLSESALKETGYFKVKKIIDMVEKHRQRTEYHRQKIWSSLMFQIWYNRFIERIV